MLSTCANLACSTPFRRLREGKLFQVETEYFDRNRTTHSVRKERVLRRVEHYWLCDECSPFVTLTFDRVRGVIAVPLPDGTGEKTVKVLPLGERAIAIEAEAEPSEMLLHEVRK